MSAAWYYAKNKERFGPVSLAELRSLVAQGKLRPADLVWTDQLPAWTPAGKVRELFPFRAVDSVPGIKAPAERMVPAPARPKQPPSADSTPVSTPRPVAAATPSPTPEPRSDSDFDWDGLRPRHWIAGGGGFLAALGIAFTAIERSPVALAFTLGGLTLVALGLSGEIFRLLAQATANIGKASKAAAERRHEARKLAVEKQRLDLEAKKIAYEQARLEQASSQQPASVNQPTTGDQAPQGQPADAGRTIVINHPPVQRWSPGLAAVLSFFIPGLGQLYKGQIINGIVWFFMVGLGYLALILPGLLLHLFCIIGAASGNPWTEGKTNVVRE